MTTPARFIALRAAATLAIVVTLVVASSGVAFATTCSNTYTHFGPAGHYYVFEQGDSYDYDGLYGQVPTVALVKNAALFQIVWNGVTAQSTYLCFNGVLHASCSIQTGYGFGTVGGHTSVGTGRNLYMEEEDLNAYTVNWNAGGHTPGANNGSEVVYSGVNDVHNNGRYDAYMHVNNSSMVLTGQAWFPSPAWNFMLPTGAYEAAYSSSGTCGSVPQYQYFGALQDGTFNGLTYENTTIDGVNWVAWGTTNTSGPAVADAPYHASNLGSGSRAGFRGWGS